MKFRSNDRLTSTSFLSIAFPSVLFVFHSLLFRNWTIDDAGITFAYAKNLANGFGLVHQPGLIPVEGYSNFLWLIVMVPFHWTGLFDAQLTAKVLGVVISLTTFVLVARSLGRTDSPLLVFVVLTLIATNTSFVVWVNSGLENSLYVLLIVCLFSLTLDSPIPGDRPGLQSTKIGLVASFIALTRPDGIIFFIAYPVALILIADGPRSFKVLVKDLAHYAAIYVAVYGSYILFRLLYFHDLLPNTYYAKVGLHSPMVLNAARVAFWTLAFSALLLLVRRLNNNVHLASRIAALMVAIDSVFVFPLLPAHLTGLFHSVAGPLAAIFFGLLTGSLVLLVASGHRDGRWSLSLLFLYLTLAAYTLLPPDWMGEYRFATPCFVFLYLYSVLTFSLVAGHWTSSFFSGKKISYGLAGALLSLNALFFFHRSLSFAEHPPPPLRDVIERAKEFNAYVERHQIKYASILTPDLGGELLFSDLRVYDLGMLCDRTIAKTLGKNQGLFYDYVFDEIKPTIIVATSHWRHLADFESDPRFSRDYVPLKQEIKGLKDGVFIRKDARDSSRDHAPEIRETKDKE